MTGSYRTKLRNGLYTTDPRLDRLPPTDWEHVEKYPLTTATVVKGVPGVLGVNWYSAFDSPVKQGSDYFIGLDHKNLGRLRGGHAIATLSGGTRDLIAWWLFYDQGSEGACVGYSLSRMMSLLNRDRYDARWLYKRAQEIDEWPGEAYSGTSVRAGCDILRLRGHRRVRGSKTGEESAAHGILENRWALSVEEVHEALAHPKADRIGAIPLLNSWGRSYPHIVWLPDETLDRLIAEDGEVALVTDRPD